MESTIPLPARSALHAFFAVADDGRVWECLGGHHADWHFGAADASVLDITGNRMLRWFCEGSWSLARVRSVIESQGFKVL